MSAVCVAKRIIVTSITNSPYRIGRPIVLTLTTMTPLSKPVAKVRMLVVVMVGMAVVENGKRVVVARRMVKMVASQSLRRNPMPFGGRRMEVVKVRR